MKSISVVGVVHASVEDLVAAARAGDQDAWSALVRNFQPLIDAISRRYRLTGPDSEDVSQSVWLKLSTHLHDIRDPRALPGWIASTTTRCSLQVLRARQRSVVVDPSVLSSSDEGRVGASVEMHAEMSSIENHVLRRERQTAVREGLARMAPRRRALLEMLAADPRPSYQEIHERLGLAVGSIGPIRARCLRQLAETPALAALFASGERLEAETNLVA